MSVRALVEEFSALDDPRCDGKVEHQLIDILVIAICAVVAGAESWEDIALYGRSKVEWLGTFLALSHGIPSHDTFRRVFMLIDTERFETCFEAWARSFGAVLDREVVAIDGKTIRGSFDRGRQQGPLHVISAWAEPVKVPLAQRVEYRRRGVIAAECWASAKLARSPTRSRRSRHSSTSSTSRAASSRWTLWAELAKKVPTAQPLEGQRRVPAGDRRQNPGERGRLCRDAQGEPGKEVHRYAGALCRNLL